MFFKATLTNMIHVIRKDGESIENLFRRFNTKLRNSGNLYLVKGKKYFQKKVTRNAQKKSAIHRTRVKNYYEFLIKSGQYDETAPSRSRR
jgi:ribosomal protein S21